MSAYRRAVGIGWVLLIAVAAGYARWKAVPVGIALPLILAFLVEFPMYLLPGFRAARDAFLVGGKVRAAGLLAASAVLPWLIYAVGTGHFSLAAFGLLCCIAVTLCFWYVAFPAGAAADLIYLGLFAAILLFKVFAKVYPPLRWLLALGAPMPKLDVSVLGHAMLIRVMALSITAIRGRAGADYRFWPTRGEWIAGVKWFGVLMPATAATYWGLGLMVLRAHPLNIVLVVGTFFGILWVTALSEEFIFRGLLQPWIEGWTSSAVAGLVVASLLFGSVHLGFHGPFPNWRFSLTAAVMGFFCGLARRQTGGIQAGMVAHALTVAVWKMFLV